MCPDDDIRDACGTERGAIDSDGSRRYLPVESVRAFLRALPTGRIYHVTFAKLDGCTRELDGRAGVVRALRGGESTIREHANLVSVYDMRRAGYRCYDVSRVLALRSGELDARKLATGDG